MKKLFVSVCLVILMAPMSGQCGGSLGEFFEFVEQDTYAQNRNIVQEQRPEEEADGWSELSLQTLFSFCRSLQRFLSLLIHEEGQDRDLL